MSLFVTTSSECQAGAGYAHLLSISGGSGSYTYALVRASDGEVPYSGPITAAQLAANRLDFDGLYDDAYTLTATDANTGESGTASFTLSCGYPNPGGGSGGGGGGGTTPPPTPSPTPGCTDPTATNYEPAANVEAGTCVYKPLVVEPFFSVPLLQSLRFIVRGGAFETLDNVLFCEQTRPGQQQRPYYFQLVQVEDGPLRVQVLTSYAAVAATVFRHGGAQVGPAVALKQVLTLEGPADPLAVVLAEDVATGTTQLRAAAGGPLPASLLGAARLTLAGGATGTYRLTATVSGSVASPDDYVLLNRPWVAPAAGALTASWLLTGPGFNVWEADLPLAGLAEGYYQVKLRATSAGWPDAVAESEPVHLAQHHPHTVVVDYANGDNCFGLVFSTGIVPRQRVPGTFFRTKNGGTSSTYRATDGSLTVLASTATRLLELETYALPAYLHEKLFLACRLDYLLVNGLHCQTDQAYETSEVRPYPLSSGHITLEQATWLGAGNSDDLGIETGPENALLLRSGGFLLLRGN